MKNFRLLIQYDGTRYSGWQKQGNTDNTIQGKIETILSRITGEPVEIHGSGRTDAGVHALGQVANFKTNSDLSVSEVQNTLNKYLPLDIRILETSEAAPRFHARLNASEKHYRYIIDNGIVADVFQRKYMTRFTENDYFIERIFKNQQNAKTTNNIKTVSLDSFRTGCQINYNIPAMQAAISLLKGEHDFRSFCDNKRMKKSTVRTITDIQITSHDNILTLDFYGNGFLYHMVRILTGTLLEIGAGLRNPEEITDILQAKSRQMAGFTAPPQGLFLAEVQYH